jgi:hypothetical protein
MSKLNSLSADAESRLAGMPRIKSQTLGARRNAGFNISRQLVLTTMDIAT